MKEKKNREKGSLGERGKIYQGKKVPLAVGKVCERSEVEGKELKEKGQKNGLLKRKKKSFRSTLEWP